MRSSKKETYLTTNSTQTAITQRCWRKPVVKDVTMADYFKAQITTYARRGLHGPGPPGSTDSVRVRAEFRPGGSNGSLNISGFLGPFFFRKEPMFVVALNLCS
jgi:hypothetical protein